MVKERNDKWVWGGSVDLISSLSLIHDGIVSSLSLSFTDLRLGIWFKRRMRLKRWFCIQCVCEFMYECKARGERERERKRGWLWVRRKLLLSIGVRERERERERDLIWGAKHNDIWVRRRELWNIGYGLWVMSCELWCNQT